MLHKPVATQGGACFTVKHLPLSWLASPIIKRAQTPSAYAIEGFEHVTRYMSRYDDDIDVKRVAVSS